MNNKRGPKLALIVFMNLLIISACKVSQNTASDGFSSLFDGKNWDGWNLKIKSGDSLLAQKVYAIENGIIHIFKGLKSVFPKILNGC